MLRLPDGIISSLPDLVLGLPRLAEQRTRPQAHLVQYELLVARPDEEIQRVLTGLGCDPDGVASASIGRADYLQASSFGDRKNVERNAIHGSSVKSRQSQLCVEEMQTVTDLVGAELLLELGYEQELLHAQKSGVLDRGREVTEPYRRIFRTWWDMRSTNAGGLPGSSYAGEPVHTALNISENRDVAIETLRGEVPRLEQILSIS
ncbi:blr2074 [Bradyrhizobium diazoefficiens USDA 110]|jgi:hypothetical protein|uniref:Blr2074 protein n=2 Tax=Bradyrhizobium TaxID=374 RepID=H7C825_BRADU|nr:NoeE-like protein [Bradyrhizobium japonicum]AHY48690.1 nodulation protein NoeE [Bradyrhizobium japonicum SEMIA 5079]AND87616.1 NoeE-like protein [Bradyrhizobium diazoefficiens USDA 110]AAG61049.1 ID855 [Bradyrhizobium japonicum]AJA65394.1 NoeE-like protein [Bradyrhizobium japonicum]APG14741.1 NoeE-like protein [Bradyrhizobium japonicum]